MTVKLKIENEKSPKKIFLHTLGIFLVAFVCLLLAMVISLSLAYLADKGLNNNSFANLSAFWKKIAVNPLALFEAYWQWGQYFIKTLHENTYRASLFIPLFAPLIFLFIIILAFVRSSYYLHLWFVLHHRFARAEDVAQMSLIDGSTLVLGDFQNQLLGVETPSSVLCFGETGSGKTTSVAIPSILHSDSTSVLAVDNSGTLAKYTSGYRAKLGKVFYFNWDLQDDPEKGNYYPRWNPLDDGNLPPLGAERDRYLKFLTSFLADTAVTDNKENYWQWLMLNALETFMQFMVSKIRQAKANDYFLAQIIEKKHLSQNDKDILISYYATMPQAYAHHAIAGLRTSSLTIDTYFPIGCWEGIPSGWQGKDLCLSMIADWLLKNYLNSRDHNGDWRQWLDGLLREAQLFNYSPLAQNGLRQLYYLSYKQRSIIFPMFLKPLLIFRNPQVRERTSGNDFKLSMLRGYRQPQTEQWLPVTVYSTANTKSTKFISRLFMETALRFQLNEHRGKGPLPMLVVMDDVGQMLRVRTLKEAVARGPRMKISFLLLCNSLHNIEKLYGHDTLEELVTNTNYKIIIADDNKILNRQLNKLAIYGTRSVQIPQGDQKQRRKSPADANYYHQLAQTLLSHRNLSVETRGYQLVLAEGYYHRPILAKNILLLQDERFRDKALQDASYALDDELLLRRNNQDNAVPDIDDSLFGTDIGIDDETELTQYMNIAYDTALDSIETAAKGSSSPRQLFPDAEADDWWLSEQAFDSNVSPSPNPFSTK